MTRARYRLSAAPGSHQYFEEPTAATLDGAIEEAKKFSKSTKSDTFRVFVSDTETIPHKCRGFAIAGKWTWMKRCKACNGAGVIPMKVPGRSWNEDCEPCKATGAVPDV